MLYIPGRTPDSFYYELDRLMDQAAIESTPDGFAFYVVESSELTIGSGVVASTRVYDDQLEVSIIVGDDLDEAARPTIAEICLETVELLEEGEIGIEGLICEAATRVIKDRPREQQQVAATSLQTVLDGYRHEISNKDQRGRVTDTDPITRRQLRHSLGWTAFSRTINEQGLATLETTLSDKGIYMPYAEGGQVLRGEIKLPQGKLGASCYFAVEKSRRGHTCKSCSGDIFHSNTRVTLTLDKKVNGFDHHHYHPVCFAETDMSLLDPKTLSLAPLPEHLKPHYGQPR